MNVSGGPPSPLGTAGDKHWHHEYIASVRDSSAVSHYASDVSMEHESTHGIGLHDDAPTGVVVGARAGAPASGTVT